MRPSILKISRYTRTVEQTLDLTWDLSDLYASPTDPELIHDLEAAKAEARSFRERTSVRAWRAWSCTFLMMSF